MVQIVDATGKGFGAKVGSDNRLFGRTVAQGPLEEEAEERANASFFVSSFATGGTDKDVLSIKNTDDKRMHITRIIFAAADVCLYTLFEVTSGTAAGTVLTQQNTDLTSATVNGVTAFGNAEVTGSLAGDNLCLVSVPADGTFELFLEGSLIMGKNDEIAVNASSSTTASVTVIAFWDAD